MNESWLGKKVLYCDKCITTVIEEEENLIVIQLEDGIKIHTYKSKKEHIKLMEK